MVRQKEITYGLIIFGGRNTGHVLHATFAASGFFKRASCGCASTLPLYFVLRENFNSAARESSPSQEMATAGNSYFPSGSAKRKLKLPSGRNLIFFPPMVTVA